MVTTVRTTPCLYLGLIATGAGMLRGVSSAGNNMEGGNGSTSKSGGTIKPARRANAMSHGGLTHDHGAAAAGQKAWAISIQSDAHKPGSSTDVAGSSGGCSARFGAAGTCGKGQSGEADALDRMMDGSPEPGMESAADKDDADADAIARRPGSDTSEGGGSDRSAHVHGANEGRHGKDERESSATGSGGDDREESALLMQDEGQDGQASQGIGGEGKGPLGHGDTRRSDKGDKFERADQNGERVDKNAESRQPRFWTAEEHKKFLEAVRLYGYGNARQIAAYVQTRNITQVSSLARSLTLTLSLSLSRARSVVYVVYVCVLCACSVCVLSAAQECVGVCVCVCVCTGA